MAFQGQIFLLQDFITGYATNLYLDEGITIPVTRMSSRLEYFCKDRVRVFNAIFNNISVIL
jgi:hypothetical protein